MPREKVGDQLSKKVSNKGLAATFFLIAILVIAVGVLAHYTQTTVWDFTDPETIFTQLDIFFVEYFFVGLFSGIFIVLGAYYLKGSEKPA